MIFNHFTVKVIPNPVASVIVVDLGKPDYSKPEQPTIWRHFEITFNEAKALLEIFKWLEIGDDK